MLVFSSYEYPFEIVVVALCIEKHIRVTDDAYCGVHHLIVYASPCRVVFYMCTLHVIFPVRLRSQGSLCQCTPLGRGSGGDRQPGSTRRFQTFHKGRQGGRGESKIRSNPIKFNKSRPNH